MKQQLEKQPSKMKEALAGQLDEKAAEPFKSLSTIGELLNFTMYHEGLHVGTIKHFKKANSVAE